MNPAGSIALALFLTTFGVIFFWYIWVKAFEWELAIWYRSNVQRRKERELEARSIDLEMGGGAGGGSKAPSKHGSKKSGGGSSKHGSKKSGEGSSKHGSKAASKKSGSKGGGGSRHDSRSGSKA